MQTISDVVPIATGIDSDFKIIDFEISEINVIIKINGQDLWALPSARAIRYNSSFARHSFSEGGATALQMRASSGLSTTIPNAGFRLNS
ncbi:hypothetical protein KXQ82_16385 [Mucilaginibacter sp. HMF5004]|uniref:hypothetical protein n=1 Tax=Mucilaginibacter rivuli TaxID=2857527 RepID=UPI001C5E91D5|nr:hypothetical protein [Mucilaginibacter rivuli]MBW4891307.1 hypothetical protein [Mucilaginibacter rivuli]